MRDSIKTAFACWVGIFLILPGCLCQLLACVGIEPHGDSVQGGPEPAIIGQSLASAIDCHCDEDVAKVAETTPTDSAPAGATAAIWLVVTDASQPAARHSLAPQPPAPRLGCHAPPRPISGR